MRVTESRMLEVATRAVSDATARTATAGEVVSSGQKVTLPSDDPTAWALGMRADVRKTRSAFRASAIASSRARLTDTDTALSTIGQILSRALTLGTQAGNDTQSASDRAAAALELRGLQQSMLAAANTRDDNGQYVLAGTKSGQPAFGPGGNFAGDAIDRVIESGESHDQAASVSGTLLTGASGVDLFATIDALAHAMEINDAPGIRAQIDTVQKAVGQLASARATTGIRMKALDDADSSRLDFERNLDEVRARLLAADPIQAASDFTASRNALAAAEQVAQQIVVLTQPR